MTPFFGSALPAFGTLAFAALKDHMGKTVAPIVPVMHNEWAASENDQIHLLQNGDQIVIYGDNRYDKILVRNEEEKTILAQWKNNQRHGIFRQGKRMSKKAYSVLKEDPDQFFYDSGLIKRSRSNVPLDVIDDIAERVEFTAQHGLKSNRIFNDPTVTEKFSEGRDDIIYSGFVNMDNRLYTRTMDVDGQKEKISFRGKQEGFTPSAWAEIVYFGHEILVIRPQPGIA